MQLNIHAITLSLHSSEYLGLVHTYTLLMLLLGAGAEVSMFVPVAWRRSEMGDALANIKTPSTTFSIFFFLSSSSSLIPPTTSAPYVVLLSLIHYMVAFASCSSALSSISGTWLNRLHREARTLIHTTLSPFTILGSSRSAINLQPPRELSKKKQSTCYIEPLFAALSFAAFCFCLLPLAFI